MGGDIRETCLHCGSEIPDGLDHCALGCEGTSVGIDTTGPGDLLFNRFEVVREIGRSGSGTVYRVHPLAGGDDLALKLYHPHLAGSPKARARLMEVMSGASLIQHAHLVRILADHAYGDRLGITMELVRGRSLADHVEGQIPGSPLVDEDRARRLDTVLRLIEELASVLDHLHSCGLAHGNIDPANLMLAEADGEDTLHLKMTDPSIGLGSGRGWWQVERRCPAAPELVDPDAPPTVATDVYAFGQVALLLIAGDVVADVQTVPPAVRDRVPRPLRESLLACLGDAKGRPREVGPLSALAWASREDLTGRLDGRIEVPAEPAAAEPAAAEPAAAEPAAAEPVAPADPEPIQDERIDTSAAETDVGEPAADDETAAPSSSVLTAHTWYDTAEQLPVTPSTEEERRATYRSPAELADKVITWSLIGLAVAFNLVFVPLAMASDCLTGYVGCVGFGTPAVCLCAYAMGRLSRGDRPGASLHWVLILAMVYAATTWGAAYLGYDHYLRTHLEGDVQQRSCHGLPFVYPAVATASLAAAVAWVARRFGGGGSKKEG